MKKITIKPVEERTELYHHYYGQTDFEFTLESDEEGIDDEEKGDGALNPRRRRTIAGCCNTRQRNDPPCRYSFPVAPTPTRHGTR